MNGAYIHFKCVKCLHEESRGIHEGFANINMKLFIKNCYKAVFMNKILRFRRFTHEVVQRAVSCNSADLR